MTILILSEGQREFFARMLDYVSERLSCEGSDDLPGEWIRHLTGPEREGLKHLICRMDDEYAPNETVFEHIAHWAFCGFTC